MKSGHFACQPSIAGGCRQTRREAFEANKKTAFPGLAGAYGCH